jgi:DNA-binding CsgD family transcriptional regulator/sugar-specific transcriptional regulator TrmB
MRESEMVSRLTAVGVGHEQERAYRYLVQAGEGRSALEVAQVLTVSPRTARELLKALEIQGLVSRIQGRPPMYEANSPEVALNGILSRRNEELTLVKQFASELQSEYRDAALRSSTSHLVEVILGREQVMRHYIHLVQDARISFDTLTKPPYVGGADMTRMLHAEDAGIQRGVRTRSVYDGDSLDEQATMAVAQHSMDIGEEARAISGLPMKLAIIDQRTGFVPLDVDEPALGALVVHKSPLLDALSALFESIWARAVPLRAQPGGVGPEEPDERALQVLRLMSAGLKDESIARALGLSRRTVQKHVTTMMTTLGARTRFQAALLARQRGWVGNK